MSALVVARAVIVDAYDPLIRSVPEYRFRYRITEGAYSGIEFIVRREFDRVTDASIGQERLVQFCPDDQFARRIEP